MTVRELITELVAHDLDDEVRIGSDVEPVSSITALVDDGTFVVVLRTA